MWWELMLKVTHFAVFEILWKKMSLFLASIGGTTFAPCWIVKEIIHLIPFT